MRTALQQAIYDLLTADGGLVIDSRSISVYDSVPQRSPTPYVTIGEDNLEPVNTDDSKGAEGVAEVTIWSGIDHAGRKLAKQVADLVQDRLDQQKPTVAGYTLAALFWDSTDNFDEADGATRRTVEGYRVILQE